MKLVGKRDNKRRTTSQSSGQTACPAPMFIAASVFASVIVRGRRHHNLPGRDCLPTQITFQNMHIRCPRLHEIRARCSPAPVSQLLARGGRRPAAAAGAVRAGASRRTLVPPSCIGVDAGAVTSRVISLRKRPVVVPGYTRMRTHLFLYLRSD
jgi:hypothetical protein